MGRLRRSINRKLEDHVYRNTAKGNTYFYFEHPVAKAKGVPRKYFGDDWKAANEFAKKVNPQLSPLKDEIADFVNTVQPEIPVVTSGDGREQQQAAKLNATCKTVIGLFRNTAECKKWKTKSYWGTRDSHLSILENEEGNLVFSKLTASICGEIFKQYREGDGRMQFRKTLSSVFKFAVNEGYHSTNVALDYTLDSESRFTKRKRARMIYPSFIRLQERAEELDKQWLSDAMGLGLATAQSRCEVVKWKIKGKHKNLITIDGQEYLKFERQKTKEKDGGSWQLIKIEGMLKDIIKRCRVRAMTQGSPFLVTVDEGRRILGKDKEHRCQCTDDHLTKVMKKVADSLDDLEGSAVFSEIRSLACRIYYKIHGFEFVRDLTNHEDAKMTEEYLKGDEPTLKEGVADLRYEMIRDIKIQN